MDVRAHVDYETFSAADLIKVGLYKYAEDPSTGAWGFTYRFTWDAVKGPLYRWIPGMADPTDLLDHISGGGLVVAHNAAFERVIWNDITRKRMGLTHWPELLASQQTCTMARASAMALPGSLEKVAVVLGTPAQKDMDGKKLMLSMCKPAGRTPTGEYKWKDNPADLSRLMLYCERDTDAETDVDFKLPLLTPDEQDLWEFDQLINERGVRVDVAAAARAVQLVEHCKKRYDRKMRQVTGGHVTKTSNPGKLLEWLQNRGLAVTHVRKGTYDDIEFLCDVAQDKDAEEAVQLRRYTAKTSTSKFQTMVSCANLDERVRGLLVFHKAKTGRWAGALVQPQNLMRMDEETESDFVQFIIGLLVSDYTIADMYDLIAVVVGEIQVLNWLAKSMRAMFIAAEGYKFVSGDYSNIEGRVNAWLARETWKLEAFEAYDRKTGPDLYNLSYVNSFGVELIDVKKPQRQIGKVQELSMGYQGSVGAFITMGQNYNVSPYEVARVVKRAVSDQEWADMAARYNDKGRNTYDLFEAEWTGLALVVQRWRRAHPATVQSWWDYQDAAIAAVAEPGTVVPCAAGRVRYFSDGNYLYCSLPSGRLISYASPRLVEKWVKKKRQDGSEYEQLQRTVHFMGIDRYTKQWSEQTLYGGLQCENIVQGTARDFLVYGMRQVEAGGYPVVLTVHDEVLSEVLKNFGSAKGYQQLLERKPDWGAGCPISAKAWEDVRYVK